MQRVTAEAMAAHAQQIETPPREQLRTPAPRFRFATVPREIKALFFVGGFVALGGLAWLFVPRKPERAIPLIGTLDSRPVTPPTAKPTPRPTPTPTPLPPGATILGTPLPAPPVAVHP